MTRSAPMSCAPRWAMSPTPPHPHTAIVSPPLGSVKSAPMNPVGAASDRKRACSSPTFSGTTKQFWSAWMSRMYSACEPA